MGNEYIFFDETIREQFVRFIAGHNIACSVRPDPMEGFMANPAWFVCPLCMAAVSSSYLPLKKFTRW